MMRIQARGGFSGNRLDWIPAEARTSPVEGQVFLFAGCAAHLDALFPDPGPRAGAAAASAVRVLNALGVVPVVSPEERCCGHDLLFAGDRTSFEALAAHNAGLVTRSGAWTVVAPCAECARALRLDMAAWLPARVRVLHFAEYLAERVGELQLRAVEARTVAFHDPCRLCRHLGVVDAPRAVLDAIPGLRRVELPRHGARAACCAGAAWGHCDRHAKAVQVERLDEATTAGAEVLVTACPKCRVHLACATEGAADRPHPDLVDLADLLAGSLPLSP
jgi:Fe-S oxidoreductase